MLSCTKFLRPFLAPAAAILVAAPVVAAEYSPTDFDMLLLFYAKVGEPIPAADLAMHYDEYRLSRDEFARRSILEKLAAYFEKQATELASYDTLSFPTYLGIGSYDFGQQSFPLTINPLMYHEFSPKWLYGKKPALLFTNSGNFTRWALPEAEARTIVNMAGPERTFVADIDYRPTRARHGHINSLEYLIIDAEIVRIRLSAVNGKRPVAVIEK